MNDCSGRNGVTGCYCTGGGGGGGGAPELVTTPAACDNNKKNRDSMSAPVYQCIYDCPRPCMARHVVLEICSCVAIAMPMHDVELAWLCTWSVLQNVSTNAIV
jgi:hypothetical protein